VKLGKYDGSTCLETFLAVVKNFSTYYKWTEETELFCLKASLRGPWIEGDTGGSFATSEETFWDIRPSRAFSDGVRYMKARGAPAKSIK